ncbi:MAG: glycosyltransferase family 2 protein [Bdellovibrionales bacterium]|nr:glycosyltransferase family 2 protein [Bdellovibrionales bacterium]
MSLSIVIPVFNEEETLPHTHQRLTRLTESAELASFRPIEIIYVNDCSRDSSAKVLSKLKSEKLPHTEVRVLEFSKNFGHSAAVLAGLEACKGDLISIIDADLQDPPELIPQMLARIGAGFDVVYGKRISREKESWFKKFTAWAFYRLLNSLAGGSIPKDTGDFRVMTQEVRDALLRCQEQDPFLRGLVAWVGFRQEAFPYVREGRKYGETKYPFKKMLKFALLALVSFSSLPLRMALYVGFLGLIFVLGIGAWAAFAYFDGRAIPGWTSLLLGYLAGQSITLVLVGVIGVYVGRIFSEVRGRPRYILRRS